MRNLFCSCPVFEQAGEPCQTGSCNCDCHLPPDARFCEAESCNASCHACYFSDACHCQHIAPLLK